MVKNAVGEDAIFEELKKEIRDSSIEKIFNENKELFPSIESNFSEFSKENLKFYLTTYKIPEVKSVDLNEIINDIKDIKEEDIEKKIKQIQEEMKEFVPKEKGVIEMVIMLFLNIDLIKKMILKKLQLSLGRRKIYSKINLVGLSKGERKEININNNLLK